MLSDLPSFDGSGGGSGPDRDAASSDSGSEAEVSVSTDDSGIVDTTAVVVANKNNSNNKNAAFEDEEDDLEIKAGNNSSEEEDDQNRGKIALLVFAVIAAIALGLGLGLGLTSSGSDDSTTTTTAGPGLPLFPGSGGGGGGCLKSKNDFNTDEIIMTFNVKKDFLNPEIGNDNDDENSNTSDTATTTRVVPDLLERDLMYVASVFHKTYNAFSDRAAIMRNAGCDPYCRQISRVVVEGRLQEDEEEEEGNGNVLQPNTLTTTRQDEDGECVPIQLVLQASGTYWTGCDEASTARSSSSEPGWPGLFGEDDFATRTSNNNIDPSGWTRRLRSLESSSSSYLRSSETSFYRRFLEQEEDEIQDDECPVCSQDTIPSFSSNEFVPVMDRFVATQLPASICSLVSVNEKK